LQSTEPRLEGIYRRLFSLEAFRFEHYDRVVYLDSDIYCCRDISELFTRTEPLLACPDGFTYGDWIAARISGGVAQKSERYGRTFAQSFNAGVLSIAPPALGEQTYEDLLGLLEPGRWREISSGKFTDQMLLNLLFDGRFEPLEACFNFMVFLEGYQQIWEGASFLDARLVHFAGAIKPWLEYEDGVLARRAPRFIKFFEAWRALLDEARAGHRSRDDREDTAKQFSAHKAWIADYNENPIEPVGRIY
jgi:lipopolysaccharide biosynthesis glycosyltransferase